MSEQQVYDADYFIHKFSKIPAKKWTTRKFIDRETGACCALGHCGMRDEENTDEAKALQKLFDDSWHTVPEINDGDADYRDFPQKTPRARVLAALRKLKTGKPQIHGVAQ